ncbi:OB-fold domain-containing protein [Gryllotalpicola koreensis]|uniref:ChsH2 C-terminal OB-fold domain-containing protein n=1 Tax=Gryllotalpicola koreensis TaxID=993086 RepID=A0ABP7ZUC9_9MICO
MPTYPVARDQATADFFDAAAAGRFLIVRDSVTGEYHEPQFDVSADPKRYERTPASGRGTIVSWAVVHERQADGSTARRTVGIVQLDEGPWWWTEIQGADPDADLDGRGVVVAFTQLGSDEGGEVLPYFRLEE